MVVLQHYRSFNIVLQAPVPSLDLTRMSYIASSEKTLSAAAEEG